MVRSVFELVSPDSESRVLTITPQRPTILGYCDIYTEVMFSFTTENKFGFISKIFTVRNFRSFFLFQIEEKNCRGIYLF